MASFPFLIRRLHRSLLLPQAQRRLFSRSVAIPKNLNRVIDHSFDGIMEVQKKVRMALKLQAIIVSHPNASLPFSQLETLSRRQIGLRRLEAGTFILKHPHVFHLFQHPVQRVLWVRLTPRALDQIQQESDAVAGSIPAAVHRITRLLRLTTPKFRIRLEHIYIARRDLGLPDDFEQSVILAHPQVFRLIATGDADEGRRTKYIEAVDTTSPMPVKFIEKAREREYRKRGSEAEDARFAFLVKFPPGFKLGKYYKIAVWKWQRLPYWSPYEDISGYDMRSLEAQRRLEKRMVATIHEILSLMVENRTTMERIGHFRQAMGLPKKMKDFFLQHQGIFYFSTRGNEGRLHTVFLREAYYKGEMVEPNEVHITRRKLGELLLMSPMRVNLDRMLTSMGRSYNRALDDERNKESDSDSGVESQFVE